MSETQGQRVNGHIRERFDTLVVGGGIAGLESALDLAEQGYRVLVVEKEASIGGKMIALSKVFPTLDCSSCITTPKMSAVAHHENIEIATHTSVTAIEENAGTHRVELVRRPTYVDEDLCIGCSLCEEACPIEYPDPFEEGLGSIRAIAVPFTNAIPQKAVLNPEYCIACGACAKVCPTDAVKFDQEQLIYHVDADSVIIASGFTLNSVYLKPQYNAAMSRNTITPMQLERLLAPHGPYGRVLRPSDGKVPDSIAFVLCAGSRDQSIGVPYCSRVCCMYSIKQAILLSGAVPLADITIYYMDIRAFGKGHEQFYKNAQAMGINFVNGKVARIDNIENNDMSLRIENLETGQVEENRHDLVVLAQGIIPQPVKPDGLNAVAGDDGFVERPEIHRPAWTGMEGVFVAGVAAGPKDIVDSIMDAGAAAAEASGFLSRREEKGKMFF
ncbi:MAG: FAD-dependent oxidoreductase [Verrucomicrobia bacterium]|nr:FAD-dependent oxidoreductase [Verrucomicrobiota bacterium]MCF7708609.1 FAD-dependent oxidoreductase [Verrucomicrobiota bacterium]